MMKVYEHILYQQDFAYVASIDVPWDKLKNRSIIISGAMGLIGSF